MNELAENLKTFAKYRLSGNSGKVFILNDKAQPPLIKQKTISMNGLRITFGGAFKILDNYDEKVLRINLKVKNISNCTNCLKTWTLKSFDAKGVELDYSLGSFFGDSRSIDNDVNLLPGSTASQNYYIEYKVPYVTLTVAIESEDSEKVDYVQLFLVEKDSVFNSVLKEQRQ